MTAEELLAQYNISLNEARQFLIDNIGTPQTIYSVAAQYNISFAMLAEIYGDDSIDGDAVKSFFSVQGFDTTSDTPSEESSDDDSSSDDSISLDLDSILTLDVTSIDAEGWDQILAEYQASIESFDWSSFGDQLSQMLMEFDWDAWAAQIQELANSLATDSSWLSEFEDWYEAVAGTDFDDTFDRSEWVWDDVDDYLDELDEYLDDLDEYLDDLDDYLEDVLANFDFSSIDWSIYAETLALFGLTTSDIEILISQLENIDLSVYADLFASLGFDTSDASSQQTQPIGISAEYSLELS